MTNDMQTAPRDTALSVRVPAGLAERIEKRRQALQQAAGLPVSKATAVIDLLTTGLDQLEK